ncbi:hypothetical protein PSQ90_01285 [Devosia rhodophyticola]|uniref:Type I secretion protein n=1 Tax=Devosia rhodophyticola TaxID=3026423 RepID=A0ABY7YY19_9HYPH|nr:hypothetical protein [Devosia rhodophyticola]WDR06122.1 hypothetical protein PSQ90_01285 [Devosia rhodophyticola]
MFFPSDSTNEIVAHFLGYFAMRLEEMKLRVGYEEYQQDAAQGAPQSDLQQISVDVAQSLQLEAFLPGLAYAPPIWQIVGRGDASFPLHIAHSMAHIPGQPNAPIASPPIFETPAGPPAPLEGDEPGSVLAIIAQHTTLIDNDVVILGDYDGPISFQSGAPEALAHMTLAVEAITGPITSISGLHNVEDIPRFIEGSAAVFHAMGDDVSADEDTTILKVDAISGSYVNGQQVDSAPDLEASLPEHLREEVQSDEADVEEVSEAITIEGAGQSDTITLHSGGNLLVNEAAIMNASLTPTFMAVAGDHHQLDAIIQTNAHIDHDHVGQGVAGAAENAANSTSTYNIATFDHEQRDTAAQAAELKPEVLPSNWQVSTVAGDLVFTEWLSQYHFAYDEDIHVLSSTGSTTTVTTGENVGLNGVSFQNIGIYFDLVMVGGSVYDANVIVQSNILYDNDTIEMLGGEGSSSGSLATSGNLLWNQANIVNVGPSEFQSGMPSQYHEAMDSLDAGNLAMPDAFRFDNMFEGFPMLRALYVSGDIYDLRYVQQTNVLGDADYVAIEEAKVAQTHPEYALSTGANALANIATIYDYDSLGGTTFVGGQTYSDSVLIQADIVAANEDGEDSNALVSEVIAFLDFDADSLVSTGDDLAPSTIPADGPSLDVMHTMLA